MCAYIYIHVLLLTNLKLSDNIFTNVKTFAPKKKKGFSKRNTLMHKLFCVCIICELCNNFA